MPNSTEQKTVKQRKVFFVSGYDPKGPGWYHGMFSREAKRQSELSGMTLEVSARHNFDNEQSVWTVQAKEAGVAVTSEYIFLRWDDIVRASWTRGPLTMLGVVFGNLYNYLRNGILWRLLGTSWNTFNAAFYPTAFVLLTILAGLLIGAGLSAVFAEGAFTIGLTVAIAAALTAMMLPIIDKKFVIYWMSRIFAFNLKQGRRDVPGLEERSQRFAQILIEAVNSEKYDEVLVVGHSTGAQLAVSVLGYSLELDPAFTEKKTTVSFMTLGGSIAMLAWLKEADWFCDQLETVANQQGLNWIDFSATQDGASFTLFDPVKGSGLQHDNQDNEKPKLLSIKMFQLFSKCRFKKVRFDWNKIHFQYICAGERLGDYDYFAIVAGCKTMTERFAHRETTRNFSKFRIKWLHRPVPQRTKANLETKIGSRSC